MNLKFFIRKIKMSSKRKLENKYDYMLSLGYNCEVTFRFNKYFNFEETSLFNWTYSKSIDDLINVLNNLDEIGSLGFKEPNPLYKCIKTNYLFHGKMKWKNIKDNPELIEKDTKDLKERIAYLSEKFIKVLSSEKRKLYIYKVKNDDITDEILEKISILKDTLKKLGGKNFDLLIISEEKYSEKFKNIEEVIYRSVKYFAPDKEVTSKKYLENGWNEIFDEFYTDKPKGYKKNKKYKFE